MHPYQNEKPAYCPYCHGTRGILQVLPNQYLCEKCRVVLKKEPTTRKKVLLREALRHWIDSSYESDWEYIKSKLTELS